MVSREEHTRLHKILLMAWGCSEHQAKGSLVLPAQKWQKGYLWFTFFLQHFMFCLALWVVGLTERQNVCTLSKMLLLETAEEDFYGKDAC